MNSITTYIQNWINSKGGWSHVVAASYLGAVAAYAAVPAFATLINNIYGATPSWFHQVALAGVGVIAWYRDNQKG